MTEQQRALPVRMIRPGNVRREDQAVATVDDPLLRVFYVRMLRIRAFELRVAELIAKGIVDGMQLSAGQEAIAVGACSALRDEDLIVSCDRPNGHALAKGVDSRRLFAEMLGRQGGLSRGKAGPGFTVDLSRGVLGSYLNGAGLSIAVGAAFTIRYRRADQVVLAFADDGAVRSGSLSEAVTVATLWKLPVIFLYENTLLTPEALQRHRAAEYLIDLAPGWGLPGAAFDGADPVAVFHAVTEAVGAARAGSGPAFLEARLDPPRGILPNDGTPDAEARQRDPIARLADRLMSMGVLTAEDQQLVEARARDETAADLDWADNQPPPPNSEIFRDVYFNPIDRHWPLLGRSPHA